VSEPDGESVLFVTLDSCRYDTFAAARTPTLDRVGPLHAAQSPSHFTFGSHAAMFMGFTPYATRAPVPLLNPKFAKLFKLKGAGFGGKGGEGFVLHGNDVIDGFRNAGYACFGSGAAGWFNTATPVSQWLTGSFDEFFYPGNTWSGARQVEWLMERVVNAGGGKVFAFLNLGETHVPYWHEGADWSRADNPCRPFQTEDRREDCRVRQTACLEHVDALLAPLIGAFADATILACADHGDCWGEDGLWEHGVPHPMTLTVPLAMRLRGRPVDVPA
jgi:hypothetical protein